MSSRLPLSVQTPRCSVPKTPAEKTPLLFFIFKDII